ncbi:MAG: hypothetical protein GKS03_15840, partial [Alphaproteobacteria bacterium]|nr:hypothetical protein [Alphaproteobacteria bacterium]
MELTLQSALSFGGMVGHMSYFLLFVSMVMRVMWVLRVLVILSALVGITYDIVWTKDPVGVFWETSLVVVNVVQLTIGWMQNRAEKFSSVRRQGFGNQELLKQVKSLARLVDVIMRRAVCDASAALRAS